jgi:hypothetical protein
MSAKEGERFDRFFKEIVERTCTEWSYEIPQNEYYSNVYNRLPLGLRLTISYGLSAGLVDDVGLSDTKSAGFRPKGVPENKGPYSWFEHNNQKKQPQPCWEYYVHLAEFIRLHKIFDKSKNVELKFEDNSMDIGIYKNDKLWICCEVKRKSSKAEELINGIKKLQTVKDPLPSGGGKDHIQKAKYIINFKPEYFYLVSIGRRYEFRVEYPEKMQFQLTEDLIPLT